ncbi:hypothetical protein [Acetivibrio cellulolyticus]|uniref:hypothetical protein n=1 Tax=Acetivibrio cellulolyticus TaxID=35830 RepID=UPI0001E2FB67|nr:hypothetical protein [Acetivibrio cellulolyticus]
MANGTQAAVTEATRLGEIGFPEFTAKLISDTFDAIVSANIRQTEAYIDLLNQVSKSLSTFINDTKDDIGGDLILQFLAKVLPDKESDSGTVVANDSTATLDASQAAALNNAIAVKDENGNEVQGNVVSDGDVIKNKYDAILDAVAKRISADKYSLLKEMVKLGVLRLVVEHGVIETRLTFNTYGSTFYEKNTSNYNRSDFNFRAKAKTGSFLSPWVKASASTSYRSVNISTTNESNRDISGSQVQIYGRVQIDFKTDYLPLNA